MEWGAKRVAPIIGYYSEYVGCSSGVFALLTLDFCNSVDTLWSVIFGGVESALPGTPEQDIDSLVFTVSTHATSCYFMFRLISDQWGAYCAYGIEGISHTDHAGHLLGMAFGFCAFVGFKSVMFFSKHNYYRRPKAGY